jgi:quinoprotein dehydrogenase-associated probable ABC transporter substrate-binding protein
MSSGSKETILSSLILAGSIGFLIWLAMGGGPAARADASPVHLVVPPAAVAAAPAPDPRVLRVCADPNNLPFSDREGRGFENRLAEIVGRDLGRRVEYYWQPQRRGFVRTTLNAGLCDAVMGLPSASGMVLATRPYYRSTYVFVSRRARHLALASFDDPRLRRLRIGIPITGNDYENPPPAQALASRGIVENVHGYPVYGDYSRPRPSWDVLNAVVAGDVDVAIAWGPLAGYFAQLTGPAIAIVPVATPGGTTVPFEFDISVGVRRGDRALAAAIDGALARHAADIQRLLAAYGVPLRQMKDGVRG